MTPYKKRLNKYIRRMAEDIQLRNFADVTIDAYTYHADKFCQHFGKTADKLGPEQIREYQLFLVKEKKVSWSTFNQAVCGQLPLSAATLPLPSHPQKEMGYPAHSLWQATEEAARGPLG